MGYLDSLRAIFSCLYLTDERLLQTILQELNTMNKSQIQSNQSDSLRNLVLEKVPRDQKIAVLKAVRSATDLEFKAAKRIVEFAPCSFPKSYTLEEAEEIAWQLEEAGARVSICCLE